MPTNKLQKEDRARINYSIAVSEREHKILKQLEVSSGFKHSMFLRALLESYAGFTIFRDRKGDEIVD